MSLEHILLGILRRPASGYDLKEEFQMGAANFWPAQLSQIYPTLKRLEKRGFLASQLAPSDKGPARRIYEITEEGRQELKHWLMSGPQLGTERFGYIGQLCFFDELEDPQETVRFIRELRSALTARHEILCQIEAEMAAEYGDWQTCTEAEFLNRSAVQIGVRSIGARIEWCNDVLEKARLRARRSTEDGSQSET